MVSSSTRERAYTRTARLALLWDRLRSSLWFLPAMIVTGLVLLALGLIELDTTGHSQALRAFPRLFGAQAEGTRGMLEAIASATITVAGVVFSVTTVALSLTSSQYSSRVLRNFLRDRSNQVALGVFVGIYAYCLVVLRTIRGGDANPFVPSFASLGAIALAFVGIALLIHFIHHITTSIQASRILASIHAETSAAVDRLYPQALGDAAPRSEVVEFDHGAQWHPIASRAAGYLTSVDGDALLRLACEHHGVVRLERRIGDFVARGQPIAAFAGDSFDDDFAQALRELVSIGEQRSMEQDAAFGVRQLVDVGLKALSPAVNDPTTAIMCVDRLSDVLLHLADRAVPSPFRDAGGAVRVIAASHSFVSFLDLSLEELRYAAREQPTVLARMIDALHALAAATCAARRDAVIEQLQRFTPTVAALADEAWRLRLVDALAAARTSAALRAR